MYSIICTLFHHGYCCAHTHLVQHLTHPVLALANLVDEELCVACALRRLSLDLIIDALHLCAGLGLHGEHNIHSQLSFM